MKQGKCASTQQLRGPRRPQDTTLPMMDQSQMIDVSWAAVWITEVSAVVDPGYVVWENYTYVHAYVLYIDYIMCYIYTFCSWATS